VDSKKTTTAHQLYDLLKRPLGLSNHCVSFDLHVDYGNSYPTVTETRLVKEGLEVVERVIDK